VLSLVTEYDGCAIRVVFSCLRNCSCCKDDDFRDESREFQHVGLETEKAQEPNVTVLIRGKFRSPWVAAGCGCSTSGDRWERHTEWRQVWWSPV